MFGVVLRRVAELRRRGWTCIGYVIAREYFPVFDVYGWSCEEMDSALGLALLAGYLAGLAPREAREEAQRLATSGMRVEHLRALVEDLADWRARQLRVNSDVEGVARALLDDWGFYAWAKSALVEVAARAVVKVLRRLGLLVDDGGGGVAAAGARGVYHT